MTDDHYRSVANLVLPINHAYCQQNGYSYRVKYKEGRSSWPDTVWHKILVAREYLDEFDWIMWIDSDAMVMNHSIKLERLIQTHENSDLIISENSFGLNSGVFLLRNCNWSHQFLADVDARKAEFISHSYPEQEAMSAVLMDAWNRSHVAYLPQWLLNTFWCEYMPGDFIVHHAGGSVEDKVKGLTPFLEKVNYLSPCNA